MKINREKEARLPASLLKELLRYDPITGEFTWLGNRSNMVKAGCKAGAVNTFGYITVQINKTPYFAHRLAWLYMTGEWPKQHIDHIDGVKANNVFSNLRDVSPSINMQNRKAAFKGNRSGLLGVKEKRKTWEANIKSNGISYYLGTFKTKDEAADAYVNAKRRLHEGCTI